MHDRLSRWTPLIFAVALANLLIAELLFLSGVAWPTASLFAGPSLVMVHLTTIGWLTLLMFGALFQFVPVITQQHLLHQDLSLAALVLIELGLLAMIAGFLLLGSGSVAAAVLPVGGAVVLSGALVGVVNLVVPITRKHPLPISGWFIVAGFCFLALTVLLGISYGIALSVPAFAPFTARVFGSGIEYHITAGLGGWFTLVAIGVSYELLPMFMLAPHQRGALGTAVLATVLAGFVVTIGAGLAQGFAGSGGLLAVLEQVGRALIGAAVVLYLIDVVRLYRSRKRAHIELHNQVAIGAFVALGLALLLGGVVTLSGAPPAGVPAFALFVMLGWLSGLAVTQLYKIIPFLAWLNRYGNMMGKGRVPRVQDLVNEKKALPIFVAWFAAVLVTVAGVLAEQVLVARLADAVLFGATLLLVREYWRAWRCSYAASAENAPPKFPFMTKEIAHEHDRAARA